MDGLNPASSVAKRRHLPRKRGRVQPLARNDPPCPNALVTAAAPTNTRDAGLVRGIGVAGLTSNVVNYTVGASIFVMPAACAAVAGIWAPVAFLVAALANAAVTLCFAEASARVPTSGGQAGFTAVAFGPFAGFLAGTLTYFANVLAAGAITAAAADTVAAIVPAAAAPAPRAAIIIGWALLLAMVNTRGVRQATRVVELATVVKLIPLALFLVVGAFAVQAANLPLPRAPIPRGLGDAVLLAVFLFAGVHGALLAGGEIHDPARTVPRALALGLGVVTLVFIGAQSIAQGILGSDTLALSRTPLADALARVSPNLRGVMLGGALVAMLGWTVSDALSTPRALFGLARDRMLPTWLGRVDPASHVPARAIGVHLALAALLAIGGSYRALALIAALVLALLFIGGCAASLRLRARGVALAGPPLALPGLHVAALVAIGAMLWAFTQGTREQMLWLLALIGGLSLWFVIGRRIAPSV